MAVLLWKNSYQIRKFCTSGWRQLKPETIWKRFLFQKPVNIRLSFPSFLFNTLINFILDYGPALTEHVLLEFGFPPSSRIGTQFEVERDLPKLHLALKLADSIMKNIGSEPKV